MYVFLNKNIIQSQLFQHFIHFTLSGAGLSIFTGFLYRYYSLKNELEFFHKKRIIIIIAIAVIIYPIPPLIPNWLQYTYSKDDTKMLIREHHPDMFYVFTNWACSIFYNEVYMKFATISAIIHIFFIGSCIFYYAIKCIRLLNAVKHSLTAATYALQKQLLIVLCFQVMIPVVCLIIPTTVLFVALLVESTNMAREFNV